MNAVRDPNWFVLTGLLFLGCGLVLIAKGAIGDTTRALDEAHARRALCQQRVDGLMSAPFLAVGLVLLMAGQFHESQLDPHMVLLALSAGFGLLLYLGYEGLIVERLFEQPVARGEAATALPAAAAAKLALPQEHRSGLQIAHAS